MFWYSKSKLSYFKDSQATSNLNSSIRRARNDQMSISWEDHFVDEWHVTFEFLELFARLESMNTHAIIETAAQNLASIFWEIYWSDSLRVGPLKSSQTLSRWDFPDLEFLEVMQTIDGYLHLSTLIASAQHFWISRKTHRQDSLLHHHKIILRLVLQIFSDLSSQIIPNFNKTVNGACDEELSVGWEFCRFNVT